MAETRPGGIIPGRAVFATCVFGRLAHGIRMSDLKADILMAGTG